MQEPFSLLGLPLYSLILLGVYYITFGAIKWVREQQEIRQKQIGATAYLEYFVRFNHGVHISAYLQLEAVLTRCNEIIAKGDDQKTIEQENRFFLWKYRTQKVETMSLQFFDIATSQSHINPARISDSLLEFKQPKAGLALYFLEQRSLFYSEVDEWNTVNNQKMTYARAVEQYKDMRDTLVPAILVGSALQDDTNLNDIKTSLKQPTRAQKVESLLKTFEKVIKAAGKSDIQAANVGKIQSGDINLSVESFDVIDVELGKNRRWWLYVPIGIFALIFLAIAFINDNVRAIIDDDQPATATCKRSFDETGNLVATECTQTLKETDLNLEDGLIVDP